MQSPRGTSHPRTFVKSKEAMASAGHERGRDEGEQDRSVTDGTPPPPWPPTVTVKGLDRDEADRPVAGSAPHQHHDDPSHPSAPVRPPWEHDQTSTPRSEFSSLPSVAHTPAGSWTSGDLKALPIPETTHDDPFRPQRGDYFSGILQNRNVTELSRAASTSTLSSTSDDGVIQSRRNSISAPQSPERRPPVAPHTATTGPTSNPQPPRPTSVPNLTHPTGRRRRDGPEYPNYPDQSFAALQSQRYPPPYQPHPLRTRSSHPSQGSSYSSSTSRSRDGTTMPPGAKTAGNTPAQSPGLFTPTISRSKIPGDESEESHYNTPLLHPTHLQAPKE